MVTVSTWFLYLIGIFWVITGALLAFTPEVAKNKFLKKLKNAPLKKLGVVPIIAGILLLISASYNRYRLLIILFGLLAILKGALCIAATDKMEKMRDWWFKASNGIYRIWGTVMIIIGSIVLIGI
ncbi:MAG: hypothetical protein A2Z72_00060 [Omnitrophica bacterium RBG_13_46_9]|nr:MAG: hypothetical protein A2Z72_00060 [Omnitrophica bacterium RBG_13_46_9]